ncbi:MAG: AAA family ATPase [Planctomycetaceae bacterium]|nr:AAA family ATPase [Planctomycetaceae bacterium]
MSSSSDPDILSRLVGKQHRDGDLSDPWETLAATEPTHEKAAQAGGDDEKLNGLLQRITRLTQAGSSGELADAVAGAEADARDATVDEFVPREPQTLSEVGLSESEVEALILKLLLSRGDLVGRDIADHIRLPFVLVDELLRKFKQDQLVVYRGSAAMNDYLYQLTDLGRERARRYAEHCSYFGAAPVTLASYVDSVHAQSLEKQHPTADDLRGAFSDLLINPAMLARLGPAVNSGRGLFLFGAPGNGKTSIAERVTAAFGQSIWIPRAIGVDGEIMRLYDPMNHEELPVEKCEGLLDSSRIDRRWIRIRRPTIVVGGELTMDNLEVTQNKSTGTSEAPVQMKSNCGTLVIDDFGRQQMSTDELLNRWIVPLEKRYDFLNMANGKKIQVPFDQLIIFSTNLEPRDLVDDAFLRRIPYKIEVIDPTEDEFRELFRLMCKSYNIPFNGDAIDYLIDTHYRPISRPFRCCQPRDLLLQVRNRCRYERREPVLTNEMLDFAVESYFAVM